MKLLVIGAAGFVGGHLLEYLEQLPNIEVFASKLSTERLGNTHIPEENVFDIDILNKEKIEEIIKRIRPEYIIHLAAQSSVSYSWKEPAQTFSINLIGTVNVLEAIRIAGIKPRILLIGSSEEYGIVGPDELPIKESRNINPDNPYAISKASQETVAKLYEKIYDIHIIMVRAFNHIGPRQSPMFVISDFAKQIAEIEKDLHEPVIRVGNLEVSRDFTDVRDIVKSYWELVRNGKRAEIYNIGSGTGYSLKSLLYKMISMSNMNIDVMVDPDKFRPADVPEIYADISKIKNHIQWQPQISMDTSLADILDYWRAKC